MRELSLNILDIVENSVRAGATLIKVSVIAKDGFLTIEIADDGKGMSEEFLRSVTDPFTTTRTTRKVGMGIPLFKMAAETANGSFDIKSKLGAGTTVTAKFEIDNVDRAPLGNLAETAATELFDGTPTLSGRLPWTTVRIRSIPATLKVNLTEFPSTIPK